MSYQQNVDKAIRVLKERAKISNLMIGLSGGKDSLCLCELVKMAGIKNVGYFNMEFLPNLRIQDDLLRYPCERFGIDFDSIDRVPSEHFMKCMHYSAYTWWSRSAMKTYPNVSRTDIFKFIAKKHKASIITGVKKCDSMQMLRMLSKAAGTCIYPLEDWTLKDVLTFMSDRKIAIPPLTKKGCRGVGLEYNNLKFIFENYPDDFAKIEEIFPFARVILLTHKYFNIKDTMRIV